MTRPGSTKMMADNVPAADATVCTMLFSWMVVPLNPRSTAIEITAAGIDVAKVNPAFRPKYTFAAVNTSVIKTPNTSERSDSSVPTSARLGVKLIVRALYPKRGPHVRLRGGFRSEEPLEGQRNLEIRRRSPTGSSGPGLAPTTSARCWRSGRRDRVPRRRDRYPANHAR